MRLTKKDVAQGGLAVLFGLLTAHCALLLVTSCTGVTARDKGLLPLTVVQYQEIILPLALDGGHGGEGFDPGQDVLPFLALLKRGDRDEIDPLQWQRIRLLALEGIRLRLEREEVGPYGAGILRESVRLMDANILRLLAR